MVRDPMWVMLGVVSGLLWGCNNYLYNVGATAAGAGFAVGIAFPLACTAVNDASAAVFLLLMNGFRGTLHLMRMVISRSGAFLCAAALLGGPVGQLSYCLGILWAGPAYALALSALYPVIGCMLARLLLRQQVTLRMGVGIVLAVAGGIITGAVVPEDALLLLPGMACALLAALCWGGEIVLAVRGMADIEPDIAITLRECISGTILLAITLFFFAGDAPLHILFAAPLPFMTLAAAGTAAGASYFLWYAVNRAIGCARGMATNATYIIWGVLLQWGIAGAEISGQMVLGCSLVFLGVLLVSLHPHPEHAAD